MLPNDLFDFFEGFGRIEKGSDSSNGTVLLNAGPIFWYYKVYFVVDGGGVEPENGVVVLVDLVWELEGQDIDDIDVCLVGSKYASALTILFLRKVLDCQPFELLEGEGTDVHFESNAALYNAPVVGQTLLQFVVLFYLVVGAIQNMAPSLPGAETDSPVLLDDFDLAQQSSYVVVEPFRKDHLEQRGDFVSSQVSALLGGRSVELQPWNVMLFHDFLLVGHRAEQLPVGQDFPFPQSHDSSEFDAADPDSMLFVELNDPIQSLLNFVIVFFVVVL